MDIITRRRRNLHKKRVADKKRVSFLECISTCIPSELKALKLKFKRMFGNLPTYRLTAKYKKMRRQLNRA